MIEQVKVVAKHDYPGIYEGDILTLNPSCNLYEKQERYKESYSETDVNDEGAEKTTEYVDTHYRYVGLSAAEVEVNLVTKSNPNGIFEYYFEEEYEEELDLIEAISNLSGKVEQLEQSINELLDEKRK